VTVGGNIKAMQLMDALRSFTHLYYIVVIVVVVVFGFVVFVIVVFVFVGFDIS